jgi:hypothetical protein
MSEPTTANQSKWGWGAGLLLFLVIIAALVLVARLLALKPEPQVSPPPAITQPAPPASEPPVVEAPVPPTEPVPLQRRADLYEDQRYGFTLKPAAGWRNLTSGDLRKNHPEARGVILETPKSSRYVQITVNEIPASQTPDPPEKFLLSMQEALGLGGDIKVSEARVSEMSGSPAVTLTTTASGIKHPVVVRHTWVYGEGIMVYLVCSDAEGTYETSRQAFDEMLASFQWRPAP